MKELLVVLIGKCGKVRDETPARRSECDGLETAIVAALAAGDEAFYDEPVDELGDASAGHADAFGDEAGYDIVIWISEPFSSTSAFEAACGQRHAKRGLRRIAARTRCAF